jgi:hypothetical protein
MHSSSQISQGALDPRAFYSVALLARVANVNVYLMRRLLRANGIAFVRSGRACLVPLVEIQRRIPPLWESLLLLQEPSGGVRRVRAVRQGHEVPRGRSTRR